MEIGTLLLQMGVVMLVAFIGAAIAIRFRLSVIIGYIIAGMLIGPYISLNILGYEYTGLVQDTSFINSLSYFGLILLLFFIGLQFPVSKLRKTKEAAIILAVMNIGINMFGGFVIGTYFGWPLIDTVFLAGVISMSSSAVTAKSLIDLKRLGNAETNFLMSMVVLESFLAMFLLTTVNGLVITSTPEAVNPLFLFLGVGLFIGFFAFLAAIVIPRTARLFERIKNEELFILFALGIVFLSAALAEVMRIPAIIGAFFIGVTFADTKLVSRFEQKLTGLKDAFVAVFFLAFGMMINPAALPNVINIVLFAIPLIIINDLFLTSALAYFIGFNKRAATAIGTSLVGRNEEAILYASVGTRAINSNPTITQSYGGTLLSPFAGVLCITMSTIAPIMMKRSQQVADFFGRRMPRSLVFGGNLVKRSLKTFIMPTYLPLYKKAKMMVASLVGFTAFTVALILTQGFLHILLGAMIPLVIFLCWMATKSALTEPSKHANYGFAHAPTYSEVILRFVARIVVGALLAIVLVAFLWQYMWQLTLVALVGYAIWVIASMMSIHNSLILKRAQPEVPKYRNIKLKTYRRGWRRASKTNNGKRR